MLQDKRLRPHAGAIVLASGLLMLGWPEAMFGQGPVALPPAPTAAGRAPVVVGLPVPQLNAAGELIVQPNVASNVGAASPFTADGSVQPAAAQEYVESLPPPGSAEPQNPAPSFPDRLLGTDPSDLIWYGDEPYIPWDEFHDWTHRWRKHVVTPTGHPGLGRERVMFAPFEIDITQPFGNFLFRFDAAYNLTKPDRAEFFWSQPGVGPPAPENSVDFQEMHFRWEAGGDVFSLATDVPIRFLDPEINDDTGGVGDIQLVQKTLMMDGHRWQMTQLLRTIFNSGNARKGLGSGHISMEPGMLCRYEWSELTYVHGQVKLLFPLGADPMYSGPVLTYGIGVSHLYYETDTIAYIPTLEFVHMVILDGQVLPPGGGPPVDVEGDNILYLAPGLRMAIDTGGDLNVVELGFSSNISISSNGWYDALGGWICDLCSDGPNRLSPADSRQPAKFA